MRSKVDRLVADYLSRLDFELRDLPRARRRELAQEIAVHIDEARSALASDDEAGLRNLLDRLGEPAEIAAEARERRGAPSRRAGSIEVAAILLLGIGGVVIPVLGWVAGVIALWVSEAWTVRDKLIGTLVIPGALLVPVYLVLAGSALALVVVLLVVLVLAPLTAVYLGRQMRWPATPNASAEPTRRAASAL